MWIAKTYEILILINNWIEQGSYRRQWNYRVLYFLDTPPPPPPYFISCNKTGHFTEGTKRTPRDEWPFLNNLEKYVQL